MDILSTPPNSQSIETLPGLPLACLTSSSRTEGNASDHSEFLRAFFYLEHRLRADRQSINGVHNNEISENDVVSRSVFTVLRHVKQGMDLNEPTFKTCRDSLHVCLQFLEHQSTWTQAIRDELAEISCHWLNYLQDNDHMMTKVFSLLIILAESQSMAIALADFLANRMMESQKVLSTWKWDGQNLLPQNILCQFCSTSFYLLLLEKTIPRLTPNVKSRLISTLSQVEPGVHTHFPLFSFSILRIVNLLSCSPWRVFNILGLYVSIEQLNFLHYQCISPVL